MALVRALPPIRVSRRTSEISPRNTHQQRGTTITIQFYEPSVQEAG
jgi:hypothetical protein